MADLDRIIAALNKIADEEKSSSAAILKTVAALVTHMNDMRRELDALQELKAIKVELQSNNKALQEMVAGLMELLAKLQPTLQTGVTEGQLIAQLAEDLGKAKRVIDILRNENKSILTPYISQLGRLERENKVLREFLSQIPAVMFFNNDGELTHIVMTDQTTGIVTTSEDKL